MSTTTSCRTRRSTKAGRNQEQPETVVVGIYCRQSVERETGGDFGSIEAQQEAVESYVSSQRSNGWVVHDETYHDLGISGATTERPALQRLLRAVETGAVQVVGVPRLDRLTRSQADFCRLLEFFEGHAVTFVSVTENFNTTTPMGRFALGLLGQVAQLEREVTAERVRDKVHASRRRGIYTGGRPVLGYDVEDRRLVVNADEADQVREIFALYLGLGSLGKVLDEVRRRRWRNKSWVNKRGDLVVGKPISKTGVRKLLGNPLYAGKMPLGDELHEGQHEAIVDEATWDAVQALLAEHARAQPQEATPRPSRSRALLAGLLRCGVCGAAMGARHSTKDGRRYPYYVCQTLQKQGAAACPGSRVSMGTMDAAVVAQLRAIGRDPELVAATVEAAREGLETRTQEVEGEAARLRKELARLGRERARLQRAEDGVEHPEVAQRLREVDEATAAAREALNAGAHEQVALKGLEFDEAHLRAALADFDGVWDVLVPAERAALLRELLASITCRVRAGDVTLDFRTEGIERMVTQAEGTP